MGIRCTKHILCKTNELGSHKCHAYICLALSTLPDDTVNKATSKLADKSVLSKQIF